MPMYRLFLGLLLTFFLSSALFSVWKSPYLPSVHDQYQAERVYEMTRAIAFGQLPPRYVLDLGFGYGYPLFNYYAPLPYYIGSFFTLLSFDLIVATKIMYSIGFLLAFLTMFYVTRLTWGTGGALLSAVLYTFAPYHAVQLYVRGSIGELYAYAFFPLVFLFLREVSQRKLKLKNIFWGALGTTLFLVSHTISIYIISLIVFCFCSVALVYFYLRVKPVLNQKIIKKLFTRTIILLVPYLLTAYFWLPAFGEISSTQLNLSSGNDVDYNMHFLNLSQIWHSNWGYAGSAGQNELDGMSFMAGKLQIVFGTLGALLFIFMSKRAPHKLEFFSVCTLVLISTFLTLSASTNIWQNVPYMNLIQFPWRMLSYLIFGLSWISGYFAYLVKHQKLTIIPQAFAKPLFLLFITAISYQQLFPLRLSLEPKFFRAESYYTKNSTEIKETMHLRGEVSAASSEYLYKNIPPVAQNPQIDGVICTMPCRVQYEQYTPDRYTLRILSASAGQVVLAKANFPGFQLFLNGMPESLFESQGRIGFALNEAGTHFIEIQLLDTPIRMIANNLSVATICILLIIYLKSRHVRTKS
jgi:hypothetical protein